MLANLMLPSNGKPMNTDMLAYIGHLRQKHCSSMVSLHVHCYVRVRGCSRPFKKQNVMFHALEAQLT